MRDRSRAVAHLLRHLDDPVALAENAVVREMWLELSAEGFDLDETIERVRGAAVDAIADLERGMTRSTARSGVILRRCDIGGEPHDTVTADLAISRRTFYGQRAAGLNFVFDEIASQVAYGDEQSDVPVQPLEISVQGARLLALCGRADEAVRHLVPVFEQLTGINRVNVACILSEFRIMADLLREASVYLECAIEAAKDLDGDGRQFAFARIAYVEALIADNDKSLHRADDPLDLHIRRLGQASFKQREQVDLLGSMVVLAARRKAWQGKTGDAVALLQSGPAADPRSSVTPLTRTHHLTLTVAYKRTLLAREDDVAADCKRLARFARRTASPYLTVFALMSRADIASEKGDHEIARIYAHEALELAAQCMSESEQATFLAGAALIANRANDYLRALTIARRAQTLVSPASFPAFFSASQEALALHGIGRLRKSLDLSDGLKDTAQIRAHPHLMGRLFRIDAANFRALGDVHRAQSALGESIEILRATENAAELVQSLELAERMLPENKLASEAAELQGTPE